MAIISAYGNIGRNGELKYTQAGTAILTFSVGSKHGFGDKATTTWFECEVWAKFAEAIADKIVKGAKVSFSGEFWLETWESQDGKKGSKAKVRIIEIDVQNNSNREPDSYAPPPMPQNSTGEIVPF